MKQKLTILAILTLSMPLLNSVINFTTVSNPVHFQEIVQKNEPLVKLKKVLKKSDLGRFTFPPNEQAILLKVKELNPDLDLDEIYLNGAYISSFDNSTKYYGQVKITYFTTTSLAEIIFKPFLGIFEEKISEKEVLKRLKNLYKNLDLDEVYVDGDYLKAVPKSKKYHGSVKLEYHVVQNLKTIVKNTDLGTFDHQPNETEVLERIWKYNPDLDLSQVVLNQQTLYTIQNSQSYFGSVKVKYKINRLLQLTTVIQNTDLGTFTKKPSNKTILEILKKLNPSLDLKEVYIKKDQVLAVPKSKKYLGAINYTFNLGS